MLAELPVLLAGLPFDELTMPRYRGPLILILGGSAMLGVSLFLSLLMQGRQVNQGNPTHPGPIHQYPHHSLHGPRDQTRSTSATGTALRPKRTGRKEVRHAPPDRTPAPRPGPIVHSTPKPPNRSSVHTSNPNGTSLSRPVRMRKKWLRAMRRTARRAGLGTPEHLVAPGGRHALQLRHCRTCRVSRGHVGCERERVTLENALRYHVPRGRVVEVSCDPKHARCRFEIFPGGR